MLAEKVTVLAKYLDSINVFSKKSIKMLPKYARINKHTIELVNSKQPVYDLIYNLRLVKLKTLKTYIKTNLANSFIWL